MTRKEKIKIFSFMQLIFVFFRGFRGKKYLSLIFPCPSVFFRGKTQQKEV